MLTDLFNVSNIFAMQFTRMLFYFQDTDIDRIADTVVGATENIKEANEEIREVKFRIH